MPLVNEVVIGLKDKDKFNSSKPVNDGVNFSDYVTNPTLPALIQLLFPSAPAPTNFPRTDLVAAFLTGVQGVNKPDRRRGIGDAASEHQHRTDGDGFRRTRSAFSPVTTRASRTVVVRATTWSMRRCGSRWAHCAWPPVRPMPWRSVAVRATHRPARAADRRNRAEREHVPERVPVPQHAAVRFAVIGRQGE